MSSRVTTNEQSFLALLPLSVMTSVGMNSPSTKCPADVEANSIQRSDTMQATANLPNWFGRRVMESMLIRLILVTIVFLPAPNVKTRSAEALSTISGLPKAWTLRERVSTPHSRQGTDEDRLMISLLVRESNKNQDRAAFAETSKMHGCRCVLLESRGRPEPLAGLPCRPRFKKERLPGYQRGPAWSYDEILFLCSGRRSKIPPLMVSGSGEQYVVDIMPLMGSWGEDALPKVEMQNGSSFFLARLGPQPSFRNWWRLRAVSLQFSTVSFWTTIVSIPLISGRSYGKTSLRNAKRSRIENLSIPFEELAGFVHFKPGVLNF
jgi:hypothetical protein